MLIAIPTYGRVQNQKTLLALPPRIRKQTSLFVRMDEYTKHFELWGEHCEIVRLPSFINSIGMTRDFIIGWAHPKPVFMMDDDLTFFARRTDDKTKFESMVGRDYEDMIDLLTYYVERYAHVGIAMREGGNRNVDPFLYNSRILRAHAFNTKVMYDFDLRFKSMQFMEDFHVTLGLLELGFTNITLNDWVQNQPGSNLPGGCSGQRTIALHNQAARRLAELHPKLVTVVNKPAVGTWKEDREDVRIEWKKAYQFGREIRTTALLDGGTGEGSSRTRYERFKALE
jgi:TET-Associated Glycosyltransferase